MRKFALIIMLISTSIFAETPHEALSKIQSLYKSKDIKTLMKERYVHTDIPSRVKSTEKILKKLVSKKKSRDLVIKFFDSIIELEPKIIKRTPSSPNETGEWASFTEGMNGKSYKLFMLKSGKWGFRDYNFGQIQK
jgi:hypothetical protein